MKKLTPKQVLFCKEYLVDLNATQACLRAGYCRSKPKTADKVGPELLTFPHVKAAIQKEMDDRAKRTEVTADVVLRELLLIAKSDIGQIFDENGHLKPIHEIPEDVRRAIAGIDVYKDFTEGVEVGETKKIKFWDKLKANELLGRHLKLFAEKHEHTVSFSLEDLVAGSNGKDE